MESWCLFFWLDVGVISPVISDNWCSYISTLPSLKRKWRHCDRVNLARNTKKTIRYLSLWSWSCRQIRCSSNCRFAVPHRANVGQAKRQQWQLDEIPSIRLGIYPGSIRKFLSASLNYKFIATDDILMVGCFFIAVRLLNWLASAITKVTNILRIWTLGIYLRIWT